MLHLYRVTFNILTVVVFWIYKSWKNKTFSPETVGGAPALTILTLVRSFTSSLLVLTYFLDIILNIFPLYFHFSSVKWFGHFHVHIFCVQGEYTDYSWYLRYSKRLEFNMTRKSSWLWWKESRIVFKASDDICTIRLDFDTFVIAQVDLIFQ